MSWTPANEIPLGTVAPDFSLPSPDGTLWTLDKLGEPRALLVAFFSTRCPFMKHIARGFSKFAREYADKGLAVVAINANAKETVAEMAEEIAKFSYTFPYVKDADQSVAASYLASCTPDFYLFDMDRRLYYHGQFDGSAPTNTMPVSGADLREAVEALFHGQSAPEDQKCAVGGCIDWKQDEDAPAWFAAG